MYVRSAHPDDIERCEALEHTYTTRRVWHVSVERRAASAVEEAETLVRIQASRLPRPLLVTLPPLETSLRLALDRYDGFWVLVDDDPSVIGYAAVHVQPGRPMGELSLINVAPAYRRQGGGTLLLERALRWASTCGLEGLICHAPNRAEPALSFYQHHGFHLCGYSEYFYTNQDIALFFAKEI
ncbi:MAG: hypothetical protein KatS3mg057_2143 [Herpetosiphonaceae bacterium]|nr:MAG: hypothetical protein KatS3mg057_2143 [Herpetosiphonaceae bacterium]